MSGRRRVDVDSAMMAILSGQETSAGGQKERKQTPHEKGRAARYVPVTFPSAAWKAAIQRVCEAWGVRYSDFMVYAAAYTMAAIERGELRRPTDGDGYRLHQRSGECFGELPWEPGS